VTAAGTSLAAPTPAPGAPSAPPDILSTRDAVIAAGATLAIALHLVLRFALAAPAPWPEVPVVAAIVLGGTPLVWGLARKALAREFGSDLLAGISIAVSAALGEHLAGAIVVLMLSGGSALEAYAVARAGSVLAALARRMPTVAHRRSASGALEDVPVEAVRPGDTLAVFPHEVSPVDGVVVEGRGVMDESYLTGEPFEIRKAPGSEVLSGAVNGASLVVVRAVRPAGDSRYARIMRVMRETEQRRPALRRLGDALGAWYTPLALAIAFAAWAASGDPRRFLAVLVIATPCPLLIAIPVAIIGAISLAARRAIVIRDPAILEAAETCTTIIFDKTGTLTYGAPVLSERTAAGGADERATLALAAALERYSKHPLAGAIIAAAEEARLPLDEATEVLERPGEGLRGRVGGREVRVAGRGLAARVDPAGAAALPPEEGGLECCVLVEGRLAARYRFRDAPRAEGKLFVHHLGRRHPFTRVLLVSGDREREVAWLAREVGIEEVHAGKSPEEKVAIVEAETRRARTLYVGDGVNDAPALLAATVGIAFGQKSDVTSEASGAVVLEPSLRRVDELFHIARHMRAVALESAVGGMALSAAGMLLAAGGLLTPVMGAVAQEAIDLLAVLNALRAAAPPRELSDY
jgi:heavy metal translocating P-type ATPase